MHSRDPDKSQDHFDTEIQAILAGSSSYHRPSNIYDFCRFVFCQSDFREATFTQGADFSMATFTQATDFSMATFTQTTDFSMATFTQEGTFFGVTFTQRADFSLALFIQDADFSRATFLQEAIFHRATFYKAVIFSHTSFGPSIDYVAVGDEKLPIAEFHHVQFLKPEMVHFAEINETTILGLRARFMDCQVEDVRFDAVRWYQRDGRMVLQDELDVLEHLGNTSYELVAIAYRRLIKNFEKARAYDLVEDCTIGEFEMKRRDPNRFPFTRALSAIYNKFPLLRRWIGEQVSVVGLYRFASIYGTSYHRALLVLALLLVWFGVLFSTAVSIQPVTSSAISTCSLSNSIGAFCGGLVHSLEVAALQRNTLYLPTTSAGRVIEIVEQVLVAGQVALLLFALQRRFRR